MEQLGNLVSISALFTEAFLLPYGFVQHRAPDGFGAPAAAAGSDEGVRRESLL